MKCSGRSTNETFINFCSSIIKMYNFSKMDQICCWTLVAFILLPKFELGETSRQLLHHRLVKREEPCSQYQFRCKSNNHCIDRFVICDGVKDCTDGSDETAELCSDIKCPGYSFRCTYGACIDATAKCNGRMDCADNSDETDVECIQPEAPTLQHCGPNLFQCKSGQCIDKNLQCNGKRNCNDGSDETIEQCENNPQCSYTSFRCDYGACIEGKFRCDGTKHCPDGSDESKCGGPPPPPPPPPPTSTTKEHSSPKACTLPETSPDKSFDTVECLASTNCKREPSKKVAQFTKLTLKCNSGYKYDDRKNFTTICSDGNWLPQIEKCNRICSPLNYRLKNIDLTCFRNNLNVDCDDELVAGTNVRPRCKPQHQLEYQVYYRVITCQENGDWSDQLFTCTPECGKPFVSTTKLIAHGVNVTYGDSPWHVAVYDVSGKDKILICGGTIISPQLIISAAHCFFNDLNQTQWSAIRYEIAVSKVTRDYNKKDNGQTTFYKIRKILFSDKGFKGEATNYAADIAILWVLEAISLSPPVLPACIPVQDDGPFHPNEGAMGKLVGWGQDEKGVESQFLLSANLPYISYKKCIEIVSHDFIGSVSVDKFCAGSKTGAGARPGDSGGGLLYRNEYTGLYFLRGIVSIKDTTGSSIALFTDLQLYIDWIIDTKNKVEREILASQTTLNSKT